MKAKNILFVLVLQCALQLIAARTYASDLLETYEWARTNNPLYQAAVLKFKGQLLGLDVSKAKNLPQLGYIYRLYHNKYNSDQSTLNVTGVDVSGCATTPIVDVNCFLNQLKNIKSEEVSSEYDQQQHILYLKQNIYDATLSAENKKMVEVIEQGKYELSGAEKDLILEVVISYIAVLRTIDEKEFQRLKVEAAETTLIMQKKSYVSGIGKESDVLDAQATYDGVVIANEVVNSSYYLALKALSAVSGVEMAIVYPVSENMPVVFSDVENSEQWVNTAINNNDSLLAGRSQERQVYHDFQAANGSKYPKFNFGATYTEDALSGGQGFSPAATTTAYGIEMQWPLYSGGAISAVTKVASYKLDATREGLIIAQKKIQAEIIQAVVQLQTDVKSYEAAKRFIQSSEDALNAKTRIYKLGGTDLLDLFKTQEKYYEAKRKLATLRYDYIEHKFKLKKLAGTLSVKDLSDLNAWFQAPTAQ